MPVLTDLDARVASDPERKDAYERSLDAAMDIAQKMPLIHVSGGTVPFERLVSEPPGEIPTSAHPEYCSDLTRRAERLLGLAPSVYFYAGRAHPDFGDVALVFAPGCEASHTGSVTPFCVFRSRVLVGVRSRVHGRYGPAGWSRGGVGEREVAPWSQT